MKRFNLTITTSHGKVEHTYLTSAGVARIITQWSDSPVESFYIVVSESF